MTSPTVGSGWIPNMPVMSADCTEPGIDEPAKVDGAVEQHVDPAGLVTGVHRERQETGGDEHEHDTGDPEHPREVELHARRGR